MPTNVKCHIFGPRMYYHVGKNRDPQLLQYTLRSADFVLAAHQRVKLIWALYGELPCKPQRHA